MRVEVTLCVAPDHPSFAGHFPGAPILPGVVLLDAAVYAATQALCTPADGGERSSSICQVASVKFLSPVRPGETLTIVFAGSASANLRFDIESHGRKVAFGMLVLPVVL